MAEWERRQGQNPALEHDGHDVYSPALEGSDPEGLRFLNESGEGGLGLYASDTKTDPQASSSSRTSNRSREDREREQRESALRNEVEMLRQQVQRMEERMENTDEVTEALPSYEEEVHRDSQTDPEQ